MAGCSRVGVDAAGGTITGGGQSTVTCNGAAIAVLGDAVAGHGAAPHDAPTMVQASGTVFAGGIAICRAGDAASCGDTATGSGNVNVG